MLKNARITPALHERERERERHEVSREVSQYTAGELTAVRV